VAEERFKEPELAINRVYTRRGDGGQTSLVGGDRVAKDDARIEAYGTADELNAQLGLARAVCERLAQQQNALSGLAESMLRVQHELFNLGSLLATPPDKVGAQQPRVRDEDTARLEREMDVFNAELPELRSFVLPGGSELSAQLHVCRTICRRLERLCVPLSRSGAADAVVVSYVNRLSDALFIWSRWADKAQGLPETLWDPNIGRSG
jgi:cob(I)alamin adenosyltransferase